jgi:HEAT repeat protein
MSTSIGRSLLSGWLLLVAAQGPAAAGPNTKSSVPQLLERLRSKDERVRRRAYWQLTQVGPEAAPHVDALIAALRSGEGRYCIPEALGKIGPPAEAALPLLAERLEAPFSFSAAEATAIVAIGAKGESDVPALLKQLRAEDEPSRLIALIQLENVCVMSKYVINARLDWRAPVAALTGALSDQSDRVRALAAKALGGSGERARSAEAALRGLFHDGNRFVRAAAIEAVGKTGGGEQTAAALRALLNDEEEWVRRKAVTALQSCARDEQTPRIIANVLANDPSNEVRAAAARCLAVLERRKAIAALARAVRTARGKDKQRLIGACASGLGSIGPDATAAGGLLADMLRQTQLGDICRAELAMALGRIYGARRQGAGGEDVGRPVGLDAAVGALAAALSSTGHCTRGEAAEALARIGPRAGAAVPALIGACGREPRAIDALRDIGPPAQAAVPRLLELLADEKTEPDVRLRVIRALDRVAPDAAEVTPHLINALGDPSGWVRDGAVAALAHKKGQAVPELIDALQDASAARAEAAAVALSKMGPAAKGAAGALIEAAGHANSDVRTAAIEALGAIGPEARAAVPLLLDVLEADYGRPAENAVAALSRIGIEPRHAARLAGARLEGGLLVAADVFELLYRRPQHALTFFRRHPRLLSRLPNPPQVLLHLAVNTDAAYAELKATVLAGTDLPPAVMAYVGQRRFVPLLKARMLKADVYKRIFLRQCMRACGGPTGPVVVLSAKQRAPFRPASAGGRGDRRRMPPNFAGAHGDGYTWVMVTGQIRMPDGKPAVEPRFYNANDRMLLGQRRRDPALLRYDPKTGRFAFLTRVFAAYARGGKTQQPGPYQTGPAVVRIEARAAKPLEAVFFDEMPEVHIILTPRPST